MHLKYYRNLLRKRFSGIYSGGRLSSVCEKKKIMIILLYKHITFSTNILYLTRCRRFSKRARDIVENKIIIL